MNLLQPSEARQRAYQVIGVARQVLPALISSEPGEHEISAVSRAFEYGKRFVDEAEAVIAAAIAADDAATPNTEEQP